MTFVVSFIDYLPERVGDLAVPYLSVGHCFPVLRYLSVVPSSSPVLSARSALSREALFLALLSTGRPAVS